MNYTSTILATALLCSTLHSQAQTPAPPPDTAATPLAVGELQLVFREGVDPAKLDALVADTRKRSNEMRAQGLKEALAKDPAKASIPFNYDCIIAALYTGERAKEANAWIRNYQKKLDERGVSLLAMFGHDGKYPGRLEADVEVKLKAEAWEFTSNFLDPEGPYQVGQSKYLQTKWNIFPLTWAHQWGTENQDIRYRPYVYLALAALRKDPAYAGKSVGGKTVEEWFGLMRDCMNDYLKNRVLNGLWIEPGSHYAHINFDVMIDLYELAPDPEVRQRAKMFLDLALIEDEQISVNGLRGGARSRTGPLAPDTSKFKNLVFGDDTLVAGPPVGPGFLLSDYQAPAVAIALRNAKGAIKPYHIYNRVPGENAPPGPNFLHNSHLISYAYRTTGYLMGTALRDPNLVYHPTSDQQRTSSLIFQSNEAVFPNPKVIPHKSGSGRPSTEQWSVQSDGTMIVQKLLKSRFVDRMEACFTANLKITEREGWIFAEAGSGYAAVRFVDPQEPSGAGKYSWSEIPPHWSQKDKPAIKVASPERDFLPIIIQAGDPAQFGSFEKFQKAVLASRITINAKASEFKYQMAGGPAIIWNYDQKAIPLILPRVDGKTPDLQPAMLFDSPFLKARWDDPKIYAGAGPFRAVYDMEKCTVTETNNSK